MKNYKIKTSFERPKARANKTGINAIAFIVFVKNCMWYDAIHDFLVWLRTSANPADINHFRGQTGKNIHSKFDFYNPEL